MIAATEPVEKGSSKAVKEVILVASGGTDKEVGHDGKVPQLMDVPHMQLAKVQDQTVEWQPQVMELGQTVAWQPHAMGLDQTVPWQPKATELVVELQATAWETQEVALQAGWTLEAFNEDRGLKRAEALQQEV